MSNTSTHGLRRLGMAAALAATAAGLGAVSVSTAQAGVHASRTPAIRTCVVPDVVGVRVTVAQARLRGAGCRLGEVSLVKRRGRHGVVVGQSIQVGRDVSTTHPVAVRVSR